MANISKIQIENNVYDVKDEYLRDKSITYFNNIYDLEQTTVAEINQIVKTLGGYNTNDGFGAYYKIRSVTQEDIIDDINIISLDNFNNLVAEKLYDGKLSLLSYDNIDYYVDGINGDDTNNGTLAHPFKTFNRFIEEFKKYAEIRCHFIGDATEYDMNTIETFNDIGMHIDNQSNNSNVTLNFSGRYTPAIYNSHFNISGDTNKHVTLNIPNNLYFDGGYIYCTYAVFTGGTLTFNGANCKLNNCTFNNNVKLSTCVGSFSYPIFNNAKIEFETSRGHLRGAVFNGTTTTPINVLWNSSVDIRTSCTLNGTLTDNILYATDSEFIMGCGITNNTQNTYDGLYIEQSRIIANNSRYSSINTGSAHLRNSYLLGETYQYLHN